MASLNVYLTDALKARMAGHEMNWSQIAANAIETAITTSPGPVTTTPLALLVISALRIADNAVIADIETEGVRIGPGHERSWDVSAMFDENEHSPEMIDMAEQGIAYGLARGFLELDFDAPHTVRITQGLAR